MRKNVTLQDIAKEAGVSKATVSFAFNDHSGIALKTKKKVLDIANKRNYRPNYFARALRTQRTQTIGVLFTNTQGDFMGAIVKGIEAATWQHGYHMLLSTCNDDQEREKAHLEMLLHKGVDGLMVFMVVPEMGQKSDYSHLINLRKKNFPLVLIDRYLPGEDIDYVVTDDFAGAYEAVSHLIRLGHRRIAHITKPTECSTMRNRLEGYKKALVDAGIEVRQEYIGMSESLTVDATYKAAEELLRLDNRPTAIFEVSGGVGTFWATKDNGLRMPEDIALIGFGNSFLLTSRGMSITAMTQPREEMGQKAAEILIEKIEHPEIDEFKQIKIKPKLIIRESCGGGGEVQNARAAEKYLSQPDMQYLKIDTESRKRQLKGDAHE